VTTHPKVDEANDKMHKAVVHLQDEFGAIRTGRAAPALVEKLKVDAYGSEMPLQQLAGITVPEARVLAIAPYDKGTIKAIEKAIQASDLGVNPSNDGNVIRVTFPELTGDRRKELVKVVKKQAEEARVAVRNVRRHIRQELEKDPGIPDDEVARIEKDLEKLTHDVVAEIDTLVGHKEKELLEV
jgi:ribosome recycling factor